MFEVSLKHVSQERQIYISLLKQYRRPCFAGVVDKKLTAKFISELTTLYNIIYDTLPTNTPFCEFDPNTKDIISDINFEINRACKRAEIEFRFVQNRLKSTSIREWESITDSHLMC